VTCVKWSVVHAGQDNATALVEQVPLVWSSYQLVPPILETAEVITLLLCPILPAVDTRATLLVVHIAPLKSVSVLEVNLALAMRVAIGPLPLKDPTLKEEGSMSLTPVLLPLSIVDTAIFETHHAKAFFLGVVIAKTHVDLAIWKVWRLAIGLRPGLRDRFSSKLDPVNGNDTTLRAIIQPPHFYKVILRAPIPKHSGPTAIN